MRKAISILNQAYKLSFDDLGEPSIEDSHKMGSNEYFNTCWAPYIKTAHICKTYGDCGYDSVFPWVYINCTEFRRALVANDMRTTFYTADGFLYVIFVGGGGGDAVKYIIIDLNGGGKPNRLGRDVFLFTRVEDDGGGIRTHGYELKDSVIKKDCSKNSSGMYCADKIRRDGWQIAKDYPW